MKKYFLFLLILLFLSIFAFSQSAEPGFSAVFAKDVVDLRSVSQLPTKANNAPGPGYKMEDLEVGSVFLTVDNHARKVVRIYEHNGRTVIETIEPRPEEVFIGLHVPEFKEKLSREDIVVSSMAEGVTLAPPGEDKTALLSSDFKTAASDAKGVTWLETDSNNNGADIIAFNIDKVLYKGKVRKDVVKKLRAKEEAAVEKHKKTEYSSQAGGKPSTDWGVEGEVRLVGRVRVVKPEIWGSLDRPSMHFTWVSKWWGGYLKISFEDGYAKAGFSAAQQFDFKLIGTVSPKYEVKIPLYALSAKKGGAEVTIGFYAKIGIDGKISLAFECSEYSTHWVEAKCKLVWPFIPVKFSASSDNYVNFGFRPMLSAEATVKAGLYLGAGLDVAGIGIASAEAGGGEYFKAEGYMEPMGIMGFDSRIGQYGNFNNWILELNAEAGHYIEATAEVFSCDFNLYEKTWPYWEWRKEWQI